MNKEIGQDEQNQNNKKASWDVGLALHERGSSQENDCSGESGWDVVQRIRMYAIGYGDYPNSPFSGYFYSPGANAMTATMRAKES